MEKLRLINQSRNSEIARSVQVADSFVCRAIGLLGKSHLSSGHSLWIKGSRWMGCNSIHTWFMRFAIDVVFVDQNLKVKAVYKNLPPWRMTIPVRGAQSVFELPAGTLSTIQTEVGDQLYVGN